MDSTFDKDKVVTRIAVSPTGELHVGTARSALFNYLFAKRYNGTFIIRIEDTDKKRSEEKYEQNILEYLAWLSLRGDTLARQSDLLERHVACIHTLLETDSAYESTEDGSQVVRLRNKGREVKFNDIIRGEIVFDTTELGDFIIARSRTSPLYHLAVVVDDYNMGVTHVIRGEDHISNTPRQILIQEALGFPRPIYAHIPLILAPNRSKLSKRTGDTAVRIFKEKGYLPTALLNYLALLGWNPGGDRELFTLTELINNFDLQNIQKGGAIFDEEKLRWFNREHIKQVDTEQKLTYFKNALASFEEEIAIKMLPLVTERVSSVKELEEAVASGEFTYFKEKPRIHPNLLAWKGDTPRVAIRHLKEIVTLLSSVPESAFSADIIKDALWGYASREGRGSVLWPMRYALTGKEKSPDPFSVAAVLGKEETLARLRVQ